MLFSCLKNNEHSIEELESLNIEGLNDILEKTQIKPWQGEIFVPGILGGTWQASTLREPKTFNLLLAESDTESNAVVRRMTDFLIEYDVVRREWKAKCASPEIIVDEKNQKLDVIYTLRDDLYWSYYNSDRKIQVTSDDVIFWYNEIEGDKAFLSSRYNSQFIKMEDGREARITIEKIDDKQFVFHFPRIIADPLLSTNRTFGPRHVYETAKKTNSIQGVIDLFNVMSDPKLIPSMGEWFLVNYYPSQRLIFKRNPDYWKKDSNGLSIPFIEEYVMQILPNQNTQFLVFMQGNLDSYTVRPEDLNTLLNRKDATYTIFAAEGSLGSGMWSFNQNPKNKNSPYYDWFTKKEFRQAMSCLLNRDRINVQVYRGLADPKLDFFPEPNPFYNPDIVLQYQYNPQKALELLISIGFTIDRWGVLRDDKNHRVEFDLSIALDNPLTGDIATIIVDELEKIGIKVNIRVTDFQKQLEQITSSHDWQSIIITLGGGRNLFPSQGANIWPSSGNLHLWYPLQEMPSTDWEARIDYLYNEGSFTINKEKAKTYWDEYQRLILEQCPVIYLMRPRGFWAIQNRWDFSNVYYDNINDIEVSHVFLAK